jgi:hypothetical protein
MSRITRLSNLAAQSAIGIIVAGPVARVRPR